MDRSTVIKIAQVAKQAALDSLARSAPGRPGKSPAERELEAARAEIERLRATVTEQACELHLYRGKALGLTGRVPARVDSHVKAGLLDLVEHAHEQGWSDRRAAQVLE